MWHAEFSSGAKSKRSLIYSSVEGTLFALNVIRVTCCAPGLPLVPPSPSPPTESETPSTNDDPGGETNPDPSHLIPNTSRDPRVIPLPESTQTLSVLFQFILSMPPPTLQNLNVEELVDILTAARKYKVYTVVSFGEPHLLSFAHDCDPEILFVYGIRNRLPRFMDAGAPAAYRNLKREELLEFCHDYDVLYAWNRYQLLWDRVIEEVCDNTLSSIPKGRKEREIYKHYNDLRSLRWENESPKVSYHRFLAMLEEDTLTLPAENPTGNAILPSDSPLQMVSVKHYNDEIKKMIKQILPFSSFLESNQKDGDVAFGQDELNSSEEEETQDGSG